jgi:hypothetical protein
MNLFGCGTKDVAFIAVVRKYPEGQIMRPLKSGELDRTMCLVFGVLTKGSDTGRLGEGSGAWSGFEGKKRVSTEIVENKMRRELAPQLPCNSSVNSLQIRSALFGVAP